MILYRTLKSFILINFVTTNLTHGDPPSERNLRQWAASGGPLRCVGVKMRQKTKILNRNFSVLDHFSPTIPEHPNLTRN